MCGLNEATNDAVIACKADAQSVGRCGVRPSLAAWIYVLKRYVLPEVRAFAQPIQSYYALSSEIAQLVQALHTRPRNVARTEDG